MCARRADSARRKEHNRNHLAVALLALLTLAGCASRTPPGCTGAVRQLNPDRWQVSPNDLVTPPGPRIASKLACPPPVLAIAVSGGAAS